MSRPRVLMGAAAAAFAAPIAVGLATATTIFQPGPNFLPQLSNWMVISTIVGVPIALIHIFAVGMPAYAILARHWPLRWWSAALGGALTATTPTVLIALVVVGIQAASRGADAAASLSLALSLLTWFGLGGTLGGLAFWLMVRGDTEGRVA